MVGNKLIKMSKIDINFNEKDNIQLKFRDSRDTTYIDYGKTNIVVDPYLSTTSKNPVQNKVVTNELNKKVNSEDLAEVAFTGDYRSLNNTPVHQKTTAEWNAEPNLIAEYRNIYIYLDYWNVDGVATPAIKIGDGTSYLIDLPTVNGLSVSEAEKLFWNNKITCYLVAIDEEDIHENNLVFSKD